MLQRKKHYKNRTIPGYKTLAIGNIDMAEVLQRPTQSGSETLELLSPSSIDGQEGNWPKAPVAAALRLSCAASQPLPRASVVAAVEDPESSGGEDGAGSDSADDVLASDDMRKRPGASSKSKLKSMAVGQQTKLKQKIVSLLKKMKAGGHTSATPNTDDIDVEAIMGELESGDEARLPPESLDELEAEIENWAPPSDNDSEGEVSLAVQPSETTPKPSLRPFFFSDLRHSSEQLPFLIESSSRKEEEKKPLDHGPHDSHDHQRRNSHDREPHLSPGPSSSPPNKQKNHKKTVDPVLPQHLAVRAS